MPIYEYRCANDHLFESFQSMSEDAISVCPECGAACERVLSPVAVHFKGSGFYTTDYARKGAKKPSETSSGSNSSESKSDGSQSGGSSSEGSSSEGSKAAGSSSGSDGGSSSSSGDGPSSD